MSYKQFIQELEDDILPAEAERRYVPLQNFFLKKSKNFKEILWLICCCLDGLYNPFEKLCM